METLTPDRPRGESPLGTDASGNGRDPLLGLVRDIVIRPSQAMRRLAAHPGRRWWFPVIALALVTTAATVAGLPASQRFTQQVALSQAQRDVEDNPEMMGDRSPEEIAAFTSGGAFAAVGIGGAVVGALLGGLIGVAVAAAVLHLLGTVLGGQQTFTQMLTVVSWAHVPFVGRELLRLGHHLIGGFDASPAGLSGLVAADPFDPEATASYLTPVLAQIELWNVWYWALLVIGVAVVAHVARRKALVGVVVLVVCQVALGLAAVAASRALGGIMGG